MKCTCGTVVNDLATHKCRLGSVLGSACVVCGHSVEQEFLWVPWFLPMAEVPVDLEVGALTLEIYKRS